MDDTQQPVQQQPENAGTQEGAVVTPKETPDALNLAQELLDSLERETKLATERDNYREGMLIAKGKKRGDNPDGDEAPTITDEERIRQIAREEYYSSESAKVKAQQDRTIKELKVALQNRTQVQTTPSGGSEPPQMEKRSPLSPEQLKHLKEVRGWDDKKIAEFEANLKK